ncbi:ATP/GTP-binding protein [Streptomyces sp. NBC_01789]|uniref:ATP/GTP-binding protein n=1 Tax=Streptomyces sp. NBC_01789 TaxID=2975941 RepID=UPI00224CAE5F|nr:ATP/GTP-binding protein [Streptomyces sp. NBC_01789]MCX4451692.1 ATP/GTP-binding protein [Streptomyces sp. NBC_01789]
MADHQGRTARNRLLISLTPAALIAASLTLGTANAAHGDDKPVRDCPGKSGFVCLRSHDEVTTRPSSGRNRESTPKKASGPKYTECVVERLDPQPPASDSLWKGHKPGDGAIYMRVCNWIGAGLAIDATVAPQMFWAADAPEATVDPLQLAHEAVDKMKLAGPDIASPRTNGTYVVGVPTWMWVDKSPTTYGPNTASATAGAVTVTATAHVTKIVWAMGDGATVTCTGGGTPYKASLGTKRSPDCGHLYRRSSKGEKNGSYHLTATSTWSVDWAVNGGGGESGQFTETRVSQLDVVIGQVKVLN